MFRVLRAPFSDASEESGNPSSQSVGLAISLERQLQYLMQLSVRVQVCEHQLQLFGTVPSWYLKQQAQELARGFAPEYQIRNELRVAI